MSSTKVCQLPTLGLLSNFPRTFLERKFEVHRGINPDLAPLPAADSQQKLARHQPGR